LAVARNTFLEAIRDKVLYTLIVFALALLLSSYVIAPLALGEGGKILRDLGLSLAPLFGLAIVVILGTALVYKEMERRTIYVLVSKPLRRWEFLIGKYIGLLSVLAVAALLMTLFFYGVLYWLFVGGEARLLWGIGFSFCELAVISAVAIFFSSLSSPTLSAVFTLAVYVAGHWTQDLRTFSTKLPGLIFRELGTFFYYVLPNLEFFNVKNDVVHGVAVNPTHALWALGYALFYSAALLALASAIYERKSFK
jgi:ABC-type transport system involved in multi-copper enzyme maturation permease subunit